MEKSNQKPSSESLTLTLGKGRVKIGHRPKLKDLALLKEQGVTHVVTILSASEGAEKLIGRIKKEGLESIWIPLGNANIIDETDMLNKIKSFLADICKVLERGAYIYIHCSAGIHRTGMITSALLHYIGIDKDQVISLLRSMRQITAAGVGDERLTWGERFRSQVI